MNLSKQMRVTGFLLLAALAWFAFALSRHKCITVHDITVYRDYPECPVYVFSTTHSLVRMECVDTVVKYYYCRPDTTPWFEVESDCVKAILYKYYDEYQNHQLH